MSDPAPLPAEEPRLDPDDDSVPPEHPAGADTIVSAGEVLSGEGIGSAAAGPARRSGAEPADEALPGDGS